MEHGGSRGLMLSSNVPRVNASCLLNFISLLLAPQRAGHPAMLMMVHKSWSTCWHERYITRNLMCQSLVEAGHLLHRCQISCLFLVNSMGPNANC